jgi:hypothetical protein
MVEINRSLYMDEITGKKNGKFDSTKKQIGSLLCLIERFQQQTQPDALGEWRAIAQRS